MAQKKMGRPPSEDSMKDRIFIRVSKETKEKLIPAPQSWVQHARMLSWNWNRIGV